MPFAFIKTLPVYSPTSRKMIEKKKHPKRARFDRENTVTDGDLDMVERLREPVKDS
jgi:hypothetical protein